MSTAAKRTRENRTITVDFRDEATYVQLLDDGKAFVERVCAVIYNKRLGECAKLPSKCDYGLTTLCPSASRYTGLART